MDCRKTGKTRFLPTLERKESFVKAVGVGLGLDVSEVVGKAHFCLCRRAMVWLEIGRWPIWILAAASARR